MMRAKVSPVGEKLAKELGRCKVFHVEHCAAAYLRVGIDSLKRTKSMAEVDHPGVFHVEHLCRDFHAIVPRGTIFS